MNYSIRVMYEFNNFMLHFPTLTDVGFSRSNIVSLEIIDKSPQESDFPQAGYSFKNFTQTHRQFYTELDNTVTECGLCLLEIAWACEPMGIRRGATEQDWEHLYKILKLVYKAMIKKGYSRYDLVT